MEKLPTAHITITLDEYQNLKDDAEILAALRFTGVKYWDGYNLAMKKIVEWNEEKYED